MDKPLFFPAGITTQVLSDLPGLLEHEWKLHLEHSQQTLYDLKSAREIRHYLLDRQTISTPGFVLRRLLWLRHPDLIQKACQESGISFQDIPDLTQSKNVPWPNPMIEKLAENLEQISRKMLNTVSLSYEELEQYVSGSKKMEPSRAFQIAYALDLNKENARKLIHFAKEETNELCEKAWREFAVTLSNTLSSENFSDVQAYRSLMEEFYNLHLTGHERKQAEIKNLEKQISALQRMISSLTDPETLQEILNLETKYLIPQKADKLKNKATHAKVGLAVALANALEPEYFPNIQECKHIVEILLKNYLPDFSVDELSVKLRQKIRKQLCGDGQTLSSLYKRLLDCSNLSRKKLAGLSNKWRKTEGIVHNTPCTALHDFFRQVQAKKQLRSPRCIHAQRWIELLTMDNISFSSSLFSREEIFIICFVLQFREREVMELLQSACAEPYNVRNPREYILFFCLNQPGYTYEHAYCLCLMYEDAINAGTVHPAHKENLTPSGEYSGNITRMLQTYQNQLLQGTLPEAQRDQELISFMAEHQDAFSLYSRTTREMLLRFTDYLSLLYFSVEELIDPLNQPTQERITKLAQEMYQHVEWPLSVHRARESHTASQDIKATSFIWEFEKFCTSNLPHLGKIEQDGSQPVTRKDIIFLVFFFLYGYLWNCTEETRQQICDLAFGTNSFCNSPRAQFDHCMQEIIGQYLDNYLEDPETYYASEHLRERISWFISCMNTFLQAFGVEKFYAPCPFDRLFLLLFLPGGDSSLDLATILMHDD